METKPTIEVVGKEARAFLLKAVNRVADKVKTTLGPGGRNALIQQDWRGQRITNDGVTIAKSIHPDNEIEKQAVDVFVETAHRTNEVAGDGTTTTVLLGQVIIREIAGNLESEVLYTDHENVMDTVRKINDAKKQVIAELDAMAKPVDTEAKLAQVASISLENEELGKKVANLVWQIGVDGYVNVEEGLNKEVETETIIGMRFDGKYLDDRLATNNHRQAIYEQVPVLITNYKLTKDHLPAIQQIIEKLVKSGVKSFVLFAENYEREAREIILNTTFNTSFKILPVKSPSLTTPDFEDLAIYTGAKFIDKNQKMTLTNLTLDDFGQADRVVVDEDDTILTGGAGSEKAVKERIKKIKEEIKAEKVEEFRRMMERRVANMASGVGIIRVGATTTAKQRYLKLKLEDAQFAAKAALAEGIVPGGGMALKKIAEKLPKNILTEALKAPYEQIQENAGGKLTIGKNIFDPVKVEKAAVEHACEVASMLLTTNTIIAEKKERPQYDGLSLIAHALEETTDSFRERHGLKGFERDKLEIDKKRMREEKEI